MTYKLDISCLEWIFLHQRLQISGCRFNTSDFGAVFGQWPIGVDKNLGNSLGGFLRVRNT